MEVHLVYRHKHQMYETAPLLMGVYRDKAEAQREQERLQSEVEQDEFQARGYEDRYTLSTHPLL
jgi:hypothetical protein